MQLETQLKNWQSHPDALIAAEELRVCRTYVLLRGSLTGSPW